MQLDSKSVNEVNLPSYSVTQRKRVKKQISQALLRRGINVQINIEQYMHNGISTRIELTSDDFQTTPVLYQRLCIEGFGTFKKNTDEQGRVFYDTFIAVKARYDLFDGGSNGVGLFFVNTRIYAEDTSFVDINISE